MRFKIAPNYSLMFADVERPQPLSDLFIEKLITDVVSGNMDRDISDNVYATFKQLMRSWIRRSYPNIVGFEKFSRIDIINGCTQYIDNLYMQGKIQVFEKDYRYHSRLGIATLLNKKEDLMPEIPLILAVPFPASGIVPPDILHTLDSCLNKKIPVHIDGAWITCSRDVILNLNHPAIESIGISLSKGMGLGWNRIGLRWSNRMSDSITIMNDFHMNNRALALIGNHFLTNLEPNYLWQRHGAAYKKVCSDFNLTPTNAIHLAIKGDAPIGISPLIRYLENYEI